MQSCQVLVSVSRGAFDDVLAPLKISALTAGSRYVLFSIGNLMPLYQAVWPQCWKTHKVCNETWVQSVTYLEIVGIMVGQIGIGAIGDGYVVVASLTSHTYSCAQLTGLGLVVVSVSSQMPLSCFSVFSGW